MVAESPIDMAAPRVQRIQASRGWRALQFGEIWRFRELILVFAWRDISVTYRQAVIGIAWVVLQPLTTVLIFSILFGYLARFPSEGLPYPVFAMAGLLPWQYFSKAVAAGSNSLVANKAIITKSYFPRLILPMAAVLAPLVDLAVGLPALIAILLIYGIEPPLTILAFPLFLSMAMRLALGLSMCLSGLNALYRDVAIALPFGLQIGMYVTPIIYPVSFIPEPWQWLIKINPMTGIIGALRWSALDAGALDIPALAISAAWIVAFLAACVQIFHRIGGQVADRV